MIHVADVRATVAWYQQIGFDVVNTYGDETGENWSFAIVKFGETWVMFNPGGKTSDARRREVDLYVYTDNVDELYQTLRDRVDVIEPPHDTFYGQRELIIRDLNRFWITFGQQSIFAALMEGINEGEVQRVRDALRSKAVTNDTLNLAFAFACAVEKRDEEILKLLKDAGAQPPPPIDLKTLESYAGSYKSEQGFGVDITVSDGRLFGATPANQPMSLWPLDQVTFRPVAMANVTMTFKVENGETTGLTVSHDGHPIELSR
jgi:uncharacterized glyoxalase superfamily protein PhnB